MSKVSLSVARALGVGLMLVGPLAHADGRDDRMAALLAQLAVTPEQMATIKDIRTQAAPQLDAARQTLQADRTNLRAQVVSSDATDDQLMTAYAQVSTDAQALHKLRFAALLKVRNVLTPTQRQQAAQLLAQRHKEHHGDPAE